MPTATYTPIANVTLSSAALSVTFSSISQIYSDLVVVYNGTTAFTNTAYCIFNGSSSTNYNTVELRGNGSTPSTGGAGGASKMVVSGDYVGTTVGNFVLTIVDYSSSTKNKSTLCRSGSGALGTNIICGRWADNTAITSITFTFANGLSGSTFSAGSTFSLYGILA